MTNEPNITVDIESARKILGPQILTLKGLIQAWNIFNTAHVLAQDYEASFDTLSWQAKMAFTKAIVVEYIKPWQSNNGKALKALASNGKINFLQAVISGDTVHKSMNELRQQSVAHTNEAFESLGISFRGVKVLNEPQNRARDAGTHESVFFPIAPEFRIARGMWWLNNKDKLGEITSHIETCRNVTADQMKIHAVAVRNECLHHMHVLEHLPDLVSLSPLLPSSTGADENPSYDVDAADDFTGSITMSDPIKTKIGDENIQGLVAVYKPSPTIPAGTKIDGKGYVLSVPDEFELGKFTWNISFPLYPHPAGD